MSHSQFHYISYSLFGDKNYLDNRSNSRANTCIIPHLGVYLLGTKPAPSGTLVIHNNFADRMASCRRRFIQISALSTFDGSIEDYHGYNG